MAAMAATDDVGMVGTDPYARLGLEVPRELHRRLKIAAARTGETMQGIALAGIERELAAREDAAAAARGR